MGERGYYFVYVLASQIGGTLYIGVTNDLLRRISEHREGIGAGFTSRYGVHRLVYYEPFDDVEQAILR
ncbi:MAG: GIY-YIG nuclease family protein, partial [Pannonibacter phragmitetus]